MSLKITVDPTSATAPFEQLREQIAGQARAGVLPVGYRMPTVRGLAETLGLAANTVAKAYRALESDGVIETRGRHGTFIAAAGDAAAALADTGANVGPGVVAAALALIAVGGALVATAARRTRRVSTGRSVR